MACLNLKAILNENHYVFNHGKHTRDFTYIDDIVDGVIKTLNYQVVILTGIAINQIQASSNALCVFII